MIMMEGGIVFSITCIVLALKSGVIVLLNVLKYQVGFLNTITLCFSEHILGLIEPPTREVQSKHVNH